VLRPGTEHATTIAVIAKPDDLSNKNVTHRFFTISFQRGIAKMEKRKFFIPYLVLFLMIATFSACGSRDKRESSEEVTRQTTTTTERPMIKETTTTTTTKTP
jgi:hypothetical protein